MVVKKKNRGYQERKIQQDQKQNIDNSIQLNEPCNGDELQKVNNCQVY